MSWRSRHNNNHRAIRLHLIVRKYVLSAFKYAGNDQGRVLPSRLNTPTQLQPMEKMHGGQKITGHRHDPHPHLLLPAADLHVVGRRRWLTGCNSMQESTQTHTCVCWWSVAEDVEIEISVRFRLWCRCVGRQHHMSIHFHKYVTQRLFLIFVITRLVFLVLVYIEFSACALTNFDLWPLFTSTPK